MKDTASDEFYETSRRNVAVLLIFWLSYITSYFLVTKFVSTGRATPSISVDGIVQKRRSNLRRLMLLGRPKSRPRSLPLSKALDKDSRSSCDEHQVLKTPSLFDPSDTLSCISDTFDSNSLHPSSLTFSPSQEAASRAIVFSSHLLSSFSLEFFTAVFGVSVVLQGICLLPATVVALYMLDGAPVCLQWEWQWLSLELVRKWWTWVWSSSLFLLLGGLPFIIILIGGKEHIDASGFQKFSILLHRFLFYLRKSKLLYVFICIFGMASLYVAAILVGLVKPIRWSFWLTLLNGLFFGISGILTLVGIPVGLASLCKSLFNRFIKLSFSRSDMEKMRLEVYRQLEEVKDLMENATLLYNGALKKRPLYVSGENTPISSKSLRSKVRKLEAQAEILRINIANSASPFWRIVWGIGVYFGVISCFSMVMYVLGGRFLGFVASHLLWYIPGVQLAHRVIFKIATTLGLAPHELDSNMRFLDRFWSNWLQSVAVHVILVSLLFIGLCRLFHFQRQDRSLLSSLEVPNHWHGQDVPLDKVFAPLALLIVSTVICAPILSMVGLYDYQPDPEVSYFAMVGTVFPAILRSLFALFHSTRVLRYPLLFWSVLGYRAASLSLVLFVGFRKVRAGGRDLWSLWNARGQGHCD